MQDFIFGGKIEAPGNPEYRVFHMRHRLMKQGGWFSFDSLLGCKWNENALPCTKMVATALNAIHGVKNVSVKPYEFSVEKASAFTWEQLMPAIKLAMAKYLP
jgi:hypothetical protein